MQVSETPRGEEINGVLTHLTDHSQNMQFTDRPPQPGHTGSTTKQSNTTKRVRKKICETLQVFRRYPH